MHTYIGSDFLLLLFSLMKTKVWDAAHLTNAQMGPFFIPPQILSKSKTKA